MLRFPLVFGLLLALPLPLAADTAERRLSALHLVETAADDALIRSLARQPVQELLRASHARRPALTTPELMALSALYYEEMHRAALTALRARAEAIARRYSAAEIAALRDFAGTAEGAEVLAGHDGITGGLAPAIEEAMHARMDAAFDRYGRAD